MRTYEIFDYPSAEPGNTLLTGVRRFGPDVLITGWFEQSGGTRSFVYRGPLAAEGALDASHFFELDYPSAAVTNLYGPNAIDAQTIRAVGAYTTVEAGATTFGCLYEGPLDGSGVWRQLCPPNATQTIAHSTHGGLVVGGYVDGRPRAFVYDIAAQRFDEITLPDLLSITAYGVWHNGRSSYTICGGYARVGALREQGYVAHWDSATRRLSRFRSFSYGNDRALITHFDGITGTPDGYNLTGDWARLELAPTPRPSGSGFAAHVGRRGALATWESVEFPPQQPTSGNTVIGDTVIGVFADATGIHGYLSRAKERCACW